MNIIQLHKDEVDQVGPLWEELTRHHEKNSTYFKEHFQTFQFSSRITIFKKRDLYTGFLALDDKVPVAYCLTSINNKTGEIDSIYIKPEYRGHHLGEKLIAKSEEWLKANGVSKIILGVAEGNESAHGFYQKQGYKPRTTIFEKTIS